MDAFGRSVTSLPMSSKVQYSVDSSVATIVLDDGKVNVLSPAMQSEIHEALDSAEDDAGAVVLAGNQKVFSAGFDLCVLQGDSPDAALDMLAGGFDLAVRLLSFPKPVIIACTGPAVAMASFLLFSGDHRVGAPEFRIQANEVAIGMTMPYAAIEMMKVRLTRSAFQRVNSMAPSFFGRRCGGGGLAGRAGRSFGGADPRAGSRAGGAGAERGRPCGQQDAGPRRGD